MFFVEHFIVVTSSVFFSCADAAEQRGGRIDQTPLSPANNQGSAHTYYNITDGM